VGMPRCHKSNVSVSAKVSLQRQVSSDRPAGLKVCNLFRSAAKGAVVCLCFGSDVLPHERSSSRWVGFSKAGEPGCLGRSETAGSAVHAFRVSCFEWSGEDGSFGMSLDCRHYQYVKV
jgi:hypothetical protein